MRILLPPSETKVSGGGSFFALEALAFSDLLERRRAVLDALVTLAADPVASAKALKISAKQVEAAVAANASLAAAPGLAAIERYTGVLFDALDAGSLKASAREWVDEHVYIHSAPFGPVQASDLLPDYRMSANATITVLGPLKRFWAAPTTAALEALEGEYVLDLRSEAYVALGPLPNGVRGGFARFVTDGPDGPRALNHFNKKGKGELVRALAQSGAAIESTEELIAWGRAHSWQIAEADGEILVVVA